MSFLPCRCRTAIGSLAETFCFSKGRIRSSKGNGLFLFDVTEWLCIGVLLSVFIYLYIYIYIMSLFSPLSTLSFLPFLSSYLR